jgi:nucleoside-diphosphate-sugar epimerase
MKIAIFGATGFIGSVYSNIYATESLTVPRFQLSSETKDIIYFISTNNNYNVFENPHLDINTNLNLLVSVLEKCRDKENIVFNFISSWFVYGKTDDLPAKEESCCNPKGFYSITKRTAEQLLISYCETFDINYRILRLCNIYGIEDKKVSKKRNALQYLIGEVVNSKDINLYNSGEDIRDFMHVEDVCRAINLVVKEAPLNEIINIGSGTPHRFIDMMNYVKQRTNSKSNFISVEPPHFHKTVQVKDMYLDVAKLNNLGFKPKYSIWDGIEMLIKNQKEY